jgi:hypothetical protein
MAELRDAFSRTDNLTTQDTHTAEAAVST